MDIQNKKWRHTTHFLAASFTFLLIISAGAFLSLAYYMSKMSSQTIDTVGKLYMTGINEQISAHFLTLMELKLEQAETVVKVVSDDIGTTNKLYEELVYRVQVRNFDYLALYSREGHIEMLYGEQIQLADPDPFFKSLKNKESKVAVGRDKSGNELVLFGISANYPMKNGKKCMALLAALPIDYISKMLDTDKEDALAYSHIIRKDGSFITNNTDTKYKDYFSSLYEKYKNDDTDKIDTYIHNLSDAMYKKSDYSAIIELGGIRQQVYCTALPYSEWHLVTILPFGSLDEAVENLNHDRTLATVLIFIIILSVMLFIFYVYFKMTCQQLRNLDVARQEALQATKAKSEFLSNMSHDIRTPMNAIVGMTAIATAHIDDKEQVQNCLKKIALSGKHLLGLINDVLDMSKIESGKMTLTAERISLREVLDGIVSIVQTQIKGKNQNFNVHLENITIEDVYCDSVRLNQVLLNLLSNAVKYTQEGGTIRLSLYQEDSPKGDTFIRTHIIVKDNGIGMTAEFLEHIFDSYSRADSKRVQKTEGAGLGMAITKYIVEAMKGTITVESEIDKGTMFHVTLDLEKVSTQEVDMVLPAWKMLVVDDDELSCRTALDVLESIGIKADWTQSGAKAVEMVTEHHQMHDDYQIVLLDWKLPDMDGVLVAKRMRRVMDADTPIILISAYDWGEFETEAKEAGINGFIAKPLFKSTLFYGLKKYICAEDTQDEPDKDIELSGRRILVAEDNELNWEVLKELLSDISMELEWAENGQICLEMFQKSGEMYYDAILMDVRMPVMNGYEATKAIRALNRDDAQNIPIIAMTADAFSEDIKRCLDSGMNAHTAKPVNLDEVVSLLKKYILHVNSGA
ncbi:MAG TPA: hybrid sensor histidine kinase/response regulator [Lachnospiraceae bacterium]|nr:hybrid sensor histidine kinase/response regulator [Lachnospiraceae bacterium]